MRPALFAAVVSSAALITLGAGCDPLIAQQPVNPPTPVAPAPATPVPPIQESPTSTDPYQGWGTVMPGGVVSLRIPQGCKGDPGAGSIFIVCPTPGNDTPVPDMHISSDGIQVNIRRWEDMESPYWEKVIASLKVIQPLDRDIQINIQK